MLIFSSILKSKAQVQVKPQVYGVKVQVFYYTDRSSPK